MTRRRTVLVLMVAVIAAVLLVPSLSGACHPSTAGQPNPGDRKIGNSGTVLIWLTPTSTQLNGDVGASASNNKVWVEGQGSSAGGYLLIGVGKHAVGAIGTTVPPKVKPCIH